MSKRAIPRRILPGDTRLKWLPAASVATLASGSTRRNTRFDCYPPVVERPLRVAPHQCGLATYQRFNSFQYSVPGTRSYCLMSVGLFTSCDQKGLWRPSTPSGGTRTDYSTRARESQSPSLGRRRGGYRSVRLPRGRPAAPTEQALLSRSRLSSRPAISNWDSKTARGLRPGDKISDEIAIAPRHERGHESAAVGRAICPPSGTNRGAPSVAFPRCWGAYLSIVLSESKSTRGSRYPR
jgi:hypothetical protein